MIKRFFDIFVTVWALILAAPVMLIAAILVRIDSSGPILFKQQRVGKDGKLFTIYKFRTMVEGAEGIGPVITAKNDSRVTQIGQILRWFKLDELPQFFNVLKGDMNLVGPRPEVPQMVEKYSEKERYVLTVKPGIIGPSQVENRDEESKLVEKENVEAFYAEKILPEKLKRDLEYIRNKDPFKDFKILVGGGASVILSSIKLRYILESKRRLLFLLIDMLIAVLCFYGAYGLRFEGIPPQEELNVLLSLLPFVIILRIPCFIYFGLYQTLWQYLGVQELFAIIKAVTLSSILLPVIPFLLQIQFPPRAVLIIDWFLLIVILGGCRMVFKLTAERLRKPGVSGNKKTVLIIGAGDTGEMLVREFIKRPALGYKPIGFLDDDPEKTSVRIHGVKVLGMITQLSRVIRVKKADEVIIALPNSSGDEIKEIITACRDLNLPCRIVPQASSLLSPQILPLKLRPIDVSDLLGRELINVDLAGIQEFFRNKKVLITGAGGSIGSELARIIFQNHPRELILVDYSENNLYDIEMDLKGRAGQTEIICYLRDITNQKEMEKIFKRHKPQLIYHAAAHKHVPMVEQNFSAGILNNVLGTKTMADLSLANGAERFVLISTDKAIHPRSIMGTTKRIAELYTQNLKGGKTCFSAVRFGNVFNSKGSVVPLFKKQIEAGGPITITHPDVTRYFMDISEAVFLILQTSILGAHSEIFILDMGKPVKIVDLARNLVQLSGLGPNDISMIYTGLRPGEKLYEEIESESEKSMPTSHKKIKIWKAMQKPSGRIAKEIEELIVIAQDGVSREAVIQKLKEIVPEYNPHYSE